jgi:hypothetical protein
MKRHLPEYIVNCFIATGYDCIDTICDMNITPGPTNFINEIEAYIEKRKSFLPSCLGSNENFGDSFPFEFPPGHRMQINKFITSLKQQQK